MMASLVGKRRNRGAVQVIVGLLVVSALIRISTEAAPALAEAAEQVSSHTTQEAVGDQGTFLAALQAREAQLTHREERLEERLATMQEASISLEEQLKQLQTAEAALRATIASAETASQADVAQLTTIYENMKPKEAAALFAAMSPDFAAGFLSLMRPDASAAIMTQLEPEIAYAFSVVLAGRNVGVPTE